MKQFFLYIIIYSVSTNICAQSKTREVIESGKTLVELIRVIKTPKQKNVEQSQNNSQIQQSSEGKIDDSCFAKFRADLCYRNISSKSLAISLYKRNGETYDPNPFTMKVLAQKQECWYQLKAGIYKYRIESDIGGISTLLAEGELKLEACDNMTREVNN